MDNVIQSIGTIAAALTSISYIPQVRKALPRGSTSDLSLKTLGMLTTGLLLWCAYGVLKHDFIIMAANGVGSALAATVLIFKIRDIWSGRATHRKANAVRENISPASRMKTKF